MRFLKISIEISLHHDARFLFLMLISLEATNKRTITTKKEQKFSDKTKLVWFKEKPLFFLYETYDFINKNHKVVFRNFRVWFYGSISNDINNDITNATYFKIDRVRTN